MPINISPKAVVHIFFKNSLTPHTIPTYNIDTGGIAMSKRDKLLGRICSLNKDLRFEELRKVLESFGYVMNAPRGGSGHYTF